MSWELLVSVAVFGLLLYLLGKYHGEAEVMEDYCATLEEELDKAQKSIGWLHSRREMESKEMLDRIADMKKAGFEGGKAAPEPDPPKPPLGNAIEQLLEAITDPVYRDDVRSECYARLERGQTENEVLTWVKGSSW